jgi:hypothetical protein
MPTYIDILPVVLLNIIHVSFLDGRDAGGEKVKALWASKPVHKKIKYWDIGYVSSLKEVIATPPNNPTSSSNLTAAETEANPINLTKKKP